MKDEPTNAKKEAKRLAITHEVLRELFLKSGNLCAFPGCNRPIMNSEGIFVGQICHIEAAAEGGERFNEHQSNEQRRSFENLMLLCYEHHTVTNDVDAYPTERMNEIKAAHEKKVFEFIEHIQLRVIDLTKLSEPKPATSLAKMRALWKMNFTPDEVTGLTDDLNTLVERLQKLPIPVRELFSVAIERASRNEWGKMSVSAHEVSIACGMQEAVFVPLWQILDGHGFVSYAGDDNYGQPSFVLCDPPSGWDIWRDLQLFVATKQATMVELIVDLNFGLLD